MVIDAPSKVNLTLTLEELSVIKTICRKYSETADFPFEGLRDAAKRFDKLTESVVGINYWRSLYDTFNEE
jgi:hypothetical protein